MHFWKATLPQIIYTFPLNPKNITECKENWKFPPQNNDICHNLALLYYIFRSIAVSSHHDYMHIVKLVCFHSAFYRNIPLCSEAQCISATNCLTRSRQSKLSIQRMHAEHRNCRHYYKQLANGIFRLTIKLVAVWGNQIYHIRYTNNNTKM